VHPASTLRSSECGYLMWGAFLLKRAQSERELYLRLQKLETARAEWSLEVAIEWRLPGEWLDTKEAAREMAETFGVVYASEEGARSSNHYSGDAEGLVAVALPRRLELRAPDGFPGPLRSLGARGISRLEPDPRIDRLGGGPFRIRKIMFGLSALESEAAMSSAGYVCLPRITAPSSGCHESGALSIVLFF